MSDLCVYYVVSTSSRTTGIQAPNRLMSDINGSSAKRLKTNVAISLKKTPFGIETGIVEDHVADPTLTVLRVSAGDRY